MHTGQLLVCDWCPKNSLAGKAWKITVAPTPVNDRTGVRTVRQHSPTPTTWKSTVAFTRESGPTGVSCAAVDSSNSPLYCSIGSAFTPPIKAISGVPVWPVRQTTGDRPTAGRPSSKRRLWAAVAEGTYLSCTPATCHHYYHLLLTALVLEKTVSSCVKLGGTKCKLNRYIFNLHNLTEPGGAVFASVIIIV